MSHLTVTPEDSLHVSLACHVCHVRHVSCPLVSSRVYDVSPADAYACEFMFDKSDKFALLLSLDIAFSMRADAREFYGTLRRLRRQLCLKQLLSSCQTQNTLLDSTRCHRKQNLTELHFTHN